MDEDKDEVRLVRGVLTVPSAQEVAKGNTSLGAIATFEGITRDYFQDKRVLELEYESYEEMALRVMRRIIAETKARVPGLQRVVIIHRLGVCPVGETSLFVAAASSHRKPGLDAIPILVDEIKAKVPIWKLERYVEQEQAPACWKQNAEWKQNEGNKTSVD